MGFGQKLYNIIIALSYIPVMINAILTKFKRFLYLRKKEEIWLSPMTKETTLTEKSKKQRDNTKTPPKPSMWLNRFTGSQPSN